VKNLRIEKDEVEAETPELSTLEEEN